MIGPQTCPICNAELPHDAAESSPLFPFCSQRCKQIDLYRWTEGKYAIVEPLTPDRLAEIQEEVGLPDPDDEPV